MRRLLLLCATVPVALLLAAAPAHAALPTLRVDLPGAAAVPDEPKAAARLQMPGYTGAIGIERRGQSSQTFPKVSYAVELRDGKGADRKVPLLGMPADGDWVLYAAYNDKTLMRNVVAYATARWAGGYAARTRFVHLRLNGRYEGIYVLMEKLELGGDRVAGDALLELTFPFQARSKAPSFLTPVRRRPIVWEDPERGDLSPARAEAIASRVRAAERALYGPGGWRRIIDEASAVDFALVNELFKNEDGFHASTYMALHADGKLRLGPVWDFDISMGNSDYGPSRRLPRLDARPARLGGAPLPRSRASPAAWPRRWRELRKAGLRRRGPGGGRLAAARSCGVRPAATSAAGRSWTGGSGPIRAPAAATAPSCASCGRG